MFIFNTGYIVQRPSDHNLFVTTIALSKANYLREPKSLHLMFYILFAITAPGVVPCGGPKKYLRTSVQIILVLYSEF